jgi:hypothetical protein
MHAIAVHGSPDAVAREIVRRYGDCDRICAYFPGYEPADDLITDFTGAMRDACDAVRSRTEGLGS